MAVQSTYTITQTLHEARGTTLLRGVREADRRPVVLKVLDPRRSRPRDAERLRHEHEICATLDLPAVTATLGLGTHEGMPALVIEDFGGEPLDRLLDGPMPIGPFLELAARVASAVADLHARDILHKDLKPSNILVNSASGQVKLTDLGIASRLAPEPDAIDCPGLIEGSLPYLAPEQTGRMNRPLDSRADLYALGVTFFEMLTGRLPFDARDPLEWVHCHVARAPPPPSALVPNVPGVLSDIVLKLLAKMAEDRYQTARGLQRDLERCIDEWHARGVLQPFALAEHDVPERFEIPRKLHGRSAEIAALLAAFERVAAAGVPELVLVSGYSGVGKSALAGELSAPIGRARGFFVSGKFDQYKRDIPYSTIVQAVRELVLGILGGSDAEIAAWQKRLLGALGVNAQLIVDVIPQVELVLGPQPAVADLAPAAAAERFRLVFRSFIGVLARKEHPLALFLDDLQWADSASLALLRDLVTCPEGCRLLVVGAFRDNEVSPTHQLVRALDEVRRAGARVTDIVLGPLSREHLAALVGEALRCRRGDAAPLSDLIHEKTAGNPFFAIQLLSMLHEEGHVAIDRRTGAFRWDIQRIRERGFSDDVVALMVEKLGRLPRRAREALKQLACLGASADVSLLAAAYGLAEEGLHADLGDAVRAGLVLRRDGAYKFLHDRVQEAAYSLIPEAERAAIHLGIGRRLSSGASPEEIDAGIFEIVSHYGRGAALITSQEERERVAEWDLAAGKRARRSMACAAALEYFAAGTALLGEDGWERRYDLAFAMELHRAECEHQTGALEAAEERLAALSRRARNLVDLAAVTSARAALYTTLDRTDLGVEACLEYLRRVGIDWSPHPTEEDVQKEYGQIWKLLGDRSIEDVVDLPPAHDPVRRATMDVLTWAQSPAMFTDENLHCLVTCRIVNISLEHGHSDGACQAYVRLGMLMGPRFGDYRAAYRFGKAGFDLLERHGLLRFKARVYLDFGHLLHPWTRHLRVGLDLLRRGLAIANETGDLLYAAYARNCQISLLLALGEPLDEVHREAEKALDFVRKTRFGLVVDVLTGQLRLIRGLLGLTPDLASFDEPGFEEAKFEQHLSADLRLALPACWYWIRKLQARLFGDDPAGAVAAAEKARALLWTSPSFFEVAEYHFYGALSRAALHDSVPAGERGAHLAALSAHEAQLGVWASSCPDNFAARHALVSAEIARIEGRPLDAERLYEDAIRAANENGFVQDEALAYEIASRFYRARGQGKFADTYLREARGSYARWGADGKVKQIDRRYPHLSEPSTVEVASTFTVRAEHLDLLSVTKASQTISGEIVLDELVHTLLTIVLEQGGAQRAHLFLCQDRDLAIQAEATLEEQGAATIFLGPVSAESSGRVPLSLIRRVQRTKERVISADAAESAGKLGGDDYLARVRPRSFLCMPVLRQAEVVGVLYLENNLLAGAFTPDRLAALELLATQAAISLQNALLLARAQAARAAAEDAERRAALVAEAGALLSESLEYEETFARLGRLCVRSLCDWCSIDIVEEREIRRLAFAHRGPEKEVLLAELQRRYPPRRDSGHPAAVVLRTGQPVLVSCASDEVLRPMCVDDDHFRILRELGTRSGLAVPLVSRGQMLGALTLTSGKPERRFGQADVDLAMEIARRAASAIDNARLYRASQEAVRARSEFLTVASHELNTPVTSLMLAVQSLRRAAASGRPFDPGAADRLLDLAARQGARLTKLVGDLLDVSRPEARRAPLDLADVDLGALVREVVERLEPDLARSRCTVSMTEESARVVGTWDRSRLDQVVTNLLCNAIKFGAGKPIDIFVGWARGSARLTVRDRGIGIGPEEHGRIFERFERAVSHQHYGGLGLGLYISHRIVEDHGGSIRCESRRGEGAMFIVDLPCSAAIREGRPPAAAPLVTGDRR